VSAEVERRIVIPDGTFTLFVILNEGDAALLAFHFLIALLVL